MINIVLIKEYIYEHLDKRSIAVRILLSTYRIVKHIGLFVKTPFGNYIYRKYIKDEAVALLLLSEYANETNQSLKIFKNISKNAESKRKIAVIVSNAEARTVMRQIENDNNIVINLQDFWLSSDVDNAVHKVANEFLVTIEKSLNNIMESDIELGHAVLLLQSLTMSMHEEIIGLLRLRNAILSAVKTGATVVYISFPIDYAKQIAIYQSFSNYIKIDCVALSVVVSLKGVVYKKLSFVKKTYERSVRLRKKNRASIDMNLKDKTASIEEIKPRSVILVTDAHPDSHYWSAVSNISTELINVGVSHLAVTSRATSSDKLKSMGANACHVLNLRRDYCSLKYTDCYADALYIYNCILSQGNIFPAQNELMLFIGNWLNSAPTKGVEARIAYEYINRLSLLLDANNTRSVVVLPHWGTLAWIAIKLAKHRGIKIISAPVVTVVNSSASIVGWNDIDLIGCYGMQCIEAFISTGVSREKLNLIGNVSLDHLDQIKRADAISKLLIPELNAKKRIILFATSGVNADEKEILINIVGLCNSPNSEATLIVRPHPSLGVGAYSYIKGTEIGGDVFVSEYGSSEDAICAADIVITDYSTVGANAISLDKAIVVINTTGRKFPANDYHEYGVADLVTESEQIVGKLKNILNMNQDINLKERKREFINAYNWQGDFRASSRLVQLM